jgi:hypothetical protein
LTKEEHLISILPPTVLIENQYIILVLDRKSIAMKPPPPPQSITNFKVKTISLALNSKSKLKLNTKAFRLVVTT